MATTLDVIDERLKTLVKAQDHQTESFKEIVKTIKQQSTSITRIETHMEDLPALKKAIDENTKKLSVIRGIGLAISAVYGFVLAFLGLK